jgi:hypothetical protein
VSTGGGALASGFVGRPAPFTTTLTGTLLATVDWTFATNDVDVFIARGDCTPQTFLQGGCNIGAFSDSATAKPERVTLAGAPAGTYTLLVANAGARDESLSWQVVLTPTASSASVEVPTIGFALPAKVRGLRAADFR